MSSFELVSQEGLRLDGRKCHELRKISSTKSIFLHADGSAYIEQGNTKVMASVFGPHQVKNQSKSLHDLMLVSCQFSMASFSKIERKQHSKADRKAASISLLLEKVFEAAILAELYPRSQINIYVQAIQFDGSNVAACINAATLALIDAGVPMKDFVSSCTSCYFQENLLTDVNNVEESSGSCKLTLAMLPRSEKIVYFQLDSRLHLENLEGLLETCKQGCRDVYGTLLQAVETDTQRQAVTLVV